MSAVTYMITSLILISVFKKAKGLAYRRLIESGCLDSSKGNYVHIEHGKFVGYGTKLSVEKYMELIKNNPGMLYSPIEQEVVNIRFSSIANINLKEWQVCITFYM
jgi:hypothetical protein